MDIFKFTGDTCDGIFDGIFKVTVATIGKTKRGYKVFKLQLNNSIWVTQLALFKGQEYGAQEYNTFYQKFVEYGDISFLQGKYILISFCKSEYGYQVRFINSYDVLADFKENIDYSEGNAFYTSMPVYDFLLSINRNIEDDGSIKIKSKFGDIRLSKDGVCYRFDTSYDKLNFNNIDIIFKQFYESVDFPEPLSDGSKSYYKISMEDTAIVRMDNRMRVSYKATTSDDYNEWTTKKILKIGEQLPEDHIKFLKNRM